MERYVCSRVMKQSNILAHTIASVFRSLCQKNSSKSPSTKLTTLPLLNQPLNFSHTQSHCCVEFETEITMSPRHFNPYYGFTTPLNSSSFYPSYHFSLYFFSNFTFLMFVNICQNAPNTSPICWFRK